MCWLLAASVTVAATEAGDKENPNQPFAAVAVVVTTATIVAAEETVAASVTVAANAAKQKDNPNPTAASVAVAAKNRRIVIAGITSAVCSC